MQAGLMKKKRICPVCGGSGQLSFFKGVSRFLLTMEECPECSGIGHLKENGTDKKTGDSNLSGSAKKRKGKKTAPD